MRAGRVGRPHGLDGSFHVNDPVPRLLRDDVPLVVGDAEARIAARKGTADRPILRLDIASDRTAIEALRGAELLVPDAAAPPLDEDEYWAEDLVGCAVADGSRSLGTVTALLALPSCEVLELDTGLLVPLVRDAIRSVDVDARRIEVDAEFLNAA
ncbi:MAG TPA: ribosome maturation factor RimM [Solirubrobacteraceae bacterium]|jgi:16S rRNA processing protein RimM|nr:ribosome maturation factor RimM [Solirubrobacteraceae bacterium]